MGQTYRSTNTYWTAYAINIIPVLHIDFTGRTYQSTNTYFWDYTMTYCYVNTHYCIWDKRIGRPTRIEPLTPLILFRSYILILRGERINRPIRISAITPWHIVMSIHIAAYGTNVSVDQYVLHRLRHYQLFCKYILLHLRQTNRCLNTYFCVYSMTDVLTIYMAAYAQTYRSTNTYCTA